MQSKLNTDLLSIIDFKLTNAAIFTPDDFNDKDVKGFDLKTELKFGYNLDDKLVKAIFKLSLVSVHDNSSIVASTLDYTLVYLYKVENIEELVFIDNENKLKVDSALGNALSSVTYSTTRGVLMTRLQGTVFENFTLPIINPNSLLVN